MYSFLLLFVEIALDQIHGYQGGYTLFLHGNTIQTVCRRHRAAPVRNHNELRALRQLMQILCKTSDVGIVERRLDLVEQTERGRL